jgi:hypothetical protein
VLDHHLQRSIVYRLALAPALRFAELKPDTIDNKLFTYHLKKVVSAGLAVKNEAGEYQLTPEGRRLGIHALENQMAALNEAVPVLFLAIRRKHDGAWLLYRRSTHPLLGKVGFMHAIPQTNEEIGATASRVCKVKTGMVANFTVRSCGYFRVFEGDNLESFTNFTLLSCDDARGELTQNDEHAEYFWAPNPNFSAPEMLPNMPTLNESLLANGLSFIDKTLRI